MGKTVGSTSPRETHDSREIDRLKSGRLVTIRKNGDYAALKAAQPKPGDNAEGGKVQASRLRRLHGGLGLLEYTVRVDDGGSSSQYPGGGDADKTVEIEMAQTERPILCRRDFNGYGDIIELWRNSPLEIRNELKYQYVNNAGETVVDDLPEKAADAARLIMKGIEAYLVFHPVVTVTTQHGSRPASYGTNIGKRCRPDCSGYPGGWDYLKTADRLTLSPDGETWTRVQQWTGASEADGGWEKTLYESA